MNLESMYVYCYSQQEGNQAIHIAASAGQMHIVKALVEEYNVPPDTANKVDSEHHKYGGWLVYRSTNLL